MQTVAVHSLVGHRSCQKRRLFVLDVAAVIIRFVELLSLEKEESQNLAKSSLRCRSVIAVRAFAWRVVDDEFLEVRLAFKPNIDVLACLETENPLVLVWTEVALHRWTEVNNLLASASTKFNLGYRLFNGLGFYIVNPTEEIGAKFAYLVDVLWTLDVDHIVKREGKREFVILVFRLLADWQRKSVVRSVQLVQDVD